MDYSAMMRGAGGALGGFGQAMMSPDMRKTYDVARSGGYQDLMQNQKIGDFVRTGRTSPENPMDVFAAAKQEADMIRTRRQGPAAGARPMIGGR